MRRKQHLNNDFFNIISNYILDFKKNEKKNAVNGKINRNSDYAGFQAKRSKCISAKLGFWSAILFWLITKIKPGLSSTCNWRRVAISSLVYKKSCVERIFQGEDLLRFPARIFNTLKFFYTHWPIHVLSWLKNKNNAFMLTRRYQFCCSRRASRQQTLVTILSKEIKNWIRLDIVEI